MNKQSIITILLIVLMSMTGEKAFAHDIEEPNADGVPIYYVWANEAETELAVSYRGSYGYNYSNEYSGNVVIPKSVEYNGNTYPVTSIGVYAFYNCRGLTSVSIPNSVTSIGNWAFHNCSGLTAVTIPNSVTSISSNAFYNCSGLTAVTIPNSVTSIGAHAFMDCSGLTAVTIGNSVTSIDYEAFRNCSSLTSVHISDLKAWCGIKFGGLSSNPLYYAYHLYLNGEEIKDLDIPNSVTSIGNCTFLCCRGMTSVTIPSSVTSIGDYAFTNCSGLTSVTIPNNVTSIGTSAFGACTRLASVTIPNSVTSIGYEAFASCNGLTSVNISDLATWCNIEFTDKLSNPLFYAHHLYINGNEITNVAIPNDVKSIGRYAFYNCNGLTSVSIPNSVTSIGALAFSGCSGLTSVTIPNSVTSIGYEAFAGCSGLSSITIPNSVTYLGGSAFEGTAWYNNQPDGLVYAGKVAYTYKGEMATDTQIMIKDGTLGIADYAFSDCRNLTSITIPNSVTSIGDKAFRDCSGLTSFTIPNSVESIGSSAFYECTGLTTITIPNSVTSIGSNAFFDCSGLTKVVSKIKNPFTISFFVFSSDIYTNAELVVPVGTKSLYEATESWNKFSKKTELLPTLETLPAQPTSTTKARLIALANEEDDDQHYGFEWLRYGAPESMPPNKVYAPLYNGQIVGSLSGLNPDIYYNYRPFYKSDAGEMVYGEWVTFLTGDANVFFEPETHTKEADRVTATGAQLSGVWIEGTEDILEKGFEYWTVSGSKTRAVGSDAQKVVVSGQATATTLEGLKAGATYGFRSYVKTTPGKTTYGEEKTFKTILLGDVDGDGELTKADADALAKHIIGQTPTGFNIKMADVNVDGYVNVIDIVCLTNMIE